MSECFTIISERLDNHNDNIAIILEIKNGKYTLHDDRDTLISLECCGFDTEDIEKAIQKTMHRISYENGIIFMPTTHAKIWPDFEFMLEEIDKLHARFEKKEGVKIC